MSQLTDMHSAGSRVEERRMLRASAADFVAHTVDHKRTRERRNVLPGYDRSVLKEIAGLGWNGILVPERFGGLGLGFAEMAIVLEELGKGLLAEPITASFVLGTRSLLHGDNPALKDALLAKIADGVLLPSVAWQEDAGGLDASAINTRAENTEDAVRISGRKRFVSGAGAADGFIVSARLGHDIGLYWVERDAPGLDLVYEWRADGTPSAILTLSDVTVKKSAMVASPDVGLRAVNRAIDETAVMVCAEMCGVMRATLDMTLEYMRTRVQFGKPIGSFQALQHRVVDLYVQQELAGAVLNEATALLDGDCDELIRARTASRAKARACEAGLRIARDAVQFHGAIAIQDECNVGLYLKRALVLSAWLGNAGEHRRRFASLSMAA